jgi:hypothetical protein
MILQLTLLDLNYGANTSAYTLVTVLLLSIIAWSCKSKSQSADYSRPAKVTYKYPFLRSTVAFAFDGPEFFSSLL